MEKVEWDTSKLGAMSARDAARVPRAAAVTGAVCVVVLLAYVCLYYFRTGAGQRDVQMVEWLCLGALLILAASAFAWVWAENLPRVNVFPKSKVAIDEAGLTIFGNHFNYAEIDEIVVSGKQLKIRLKDGRERSLAVPTTTSVGDITAVVNGKTKVTLTES